MPRIDDLRRTAALFQVLGSPTRLAILSRLEKRSFSVNELVAWLGISQPLVSQHLRVLRQERLVNMTRHGKESLYGLSDAHISHIVEDAIRHSRERTRK
ncbi:MAG: winged helix-turn-helix transcriptional regulator [Gemmatimonadetes bacterium]|nr:winged helix-turn-helix transcriptional regulator [Gemmatimonadota bacterium]